MIIADMTLDLPAEAAFLPFVRNQLDALLNHLGVRDDIISRAKIVVTEACTNVIRHAYHDFGQRYLVEIECNEDQLLVSVVDNGKGFNPGNVPKPKPGQLGGYGLYFIRQTADNVSFESSYDNGTKMVAEIHLEYRDEKSADAFDDYDLTSGHLCVESQPEVQKNPADTKV
jgi:serine/threonine-protein kinase RsbW